ncbi:class I adenylate-forming enzyme family protein [Janthinobacterium sp.]|uniref:class I adenylate-forming enzyme family protein n=1 Tax=Janthinobacterium sp. TaxID=1871054 RepID=UPI002585D192|nr:class I adenylate-forming enzyme family protein [Janthinobacterium sp.]MCX7292683.1 class I adenylate-forming enzyme family protein [Janthinobacterium sp.]
MLKTTLDTLVCPACRLPLHSDTPAGASAPLLEALLRCLACAIEIPVVQGFVLFTEARQSGDAQMLSALRAQLTPSADYLSFMHRRHVRRIPDRYAAFQPFNESTRAFYALLDLASAHLQAGDLILDTWGRTGWSGEMLAAAFPQQHVISIWEGNFDVLGYMGYAHWLATGRRAPNHDIIFLPPGSPMPFRDSTFALIHGLDSLHRYAPSTFAGDMLRIASSDAPIVFPHVHMANSQPVPYFERGGNILHGRSYQQRFDAAQARGERKTLVMSEVTLFDARGQLHGEPDTAHYNGLVALVPPAWEGAPLRQADLDLALPASRAVVNALLRLDSLNGCAVPDTDALGGLMQDLLVRHPCYAQRLARLGPQKLSAEQLQILFQLGQLRSLEQVAQRLHLPVEYVCQQAKSMAATELLQMAPISGAMARLQSYYASQIVRPLPQEETFEYLWALLPALYQQRPLLLCGMDDSAFGWAEVALLVPALQRGLLAMGVRAGDRIAMLCAHHPEAVLLSWASWRIGAVVVPLRKELTDTPALLQPLLERIAPALLVLDHPRHGASALTRCPVLLLDDLGQEAAAALPPGCALPELSTLLEDWMELPPAPALPGQAVRPDDPAVILFTSGSTGIPKGVVHSQRALMQSGQLAATEFGWHDGDVLLSLGDCHTMSGLRNPMVAALFAGASVYLADENERGNVSKTLQAAQSHGVTVLATGPAWLAMLQRLPAHLTLHPPSLRQIISTGAPLQSPLHTALSERMRLAIIDYYGLTETGGLCMLFRHAPGATQACGRPVGAVAQICNGDGLPLGPGQPGELRVHSNQLMTAYWGDPAQTAAIARDGWIYTGDIASHDGLGNITLLGRHDDQLKNEYGDIVHPAPLEHAMCSHPLVRQAAVTAGPQGLIAMLVVDDGFDLPAFVAFCRQHPHIDTVPRELRVQAALPYTTAGKLDRRALAHSVSP